MREICQSGSEGGARFYSLLLPLSKPGGSWMRLGVAKLLESGSLLPVWVGGWSVGG